MTCGEDQVIVFNRILVYTLADSFCLVPDSELSSVQATRCELMSNCDIGARTRSRVSLTASSFFREERSLSGEHVHGEVAPASARS